MNRTLAVCPTCTWPILAEVGQCVRCRPLARADVPAETIEEEIARTVGGQMPSMAVFSETQQASAAEKQLELAWRQAHDAVAQRRKKAATRRWPAVVAVMVIAAVAGSFFVLRQGSSGEPTLTTPTNQLPWRGVVIESGATVELPGVAVSSTTTSEIGKGTRTATTVPGATVAVSTYRTDFGMRGAGASAIELLNARAADLGDVSSASRIKQNRDRWGDAYDLTVINDEPIARIRVVVVGTTLFMIEVVGPQTTRTSQIFSRVVNTLHPQT